MTTPALPVSPPSAQGVDPAGILAFLDAVEAAPTIEPHSVVIVRHGTVVANGWWAPYSRDRVHLLYSLSKSFTSTAAGFAVADGLVDLDRTVLSYFPELDGEVPDPRSRAMLVRHVASMASGHTAEALGRAVAEDRLDLVRGFLRVPPERDPGSVFAYNQPNTFTLSAIVQRVTGQSLTSYLRPRLFEVLGIEEVFWQRDGSGREIGFSGLHAGTDAIAALGQLYLDRGMWQGRRLLDEAWVAQATRSQVSTAGEPNPDWQQGYGFQFWRSRHGYRGDGAYGQFCLVLPEQDAVVATTAATPDMQLLLELVWQHLLPAFGDHPGQVGEPAGSGDAELAHRLSTLALPVPGFAAEPVGAEPVGAEPTVARSGWAGTRFAPEGGTCPEQPTLSAVELVEILGSAQDVGSTEDVGSAQDVGSAEPGGRWSLTLVEENARLVLDWGSDGWSISEATGPTGPVPLAASGGWTDPATLQVHVIFLETPHRLVVTCSAASRTFTAAWATTPLGGDALHTLHAPRPVADTPVAAATDLSLRS